MDLSKIGNSVQVEVHGPIALVSLNRPDRQNTFNTQMRADLLAAVEAVEAASDIRVAVLTGNGRNFSAGADLDNPRPAGYSIEQQINEEYKPALLAITRSAKPWISAVNGAAAGVGSAFVMACDLTVMGTRAYLYQAFAAIGLIPDGGIAWQLIQTVGRKRAYEFIVGGEKMTAERCQLLGLANRVVPDDELVSYSLTWAGELAAKAPLALSSSKAALAFAADASLSDTISFEACLQERCVGSEDFREGALAFREKRPPRFTGR